MNKKKIVITGCTSGIGKSLLTDLLNRKDIYLIGICRNPNKIKNIAKLNKNNLKLIKCNFLRIQDVKNLLIKLKKIKNINILINNAGSLFFRNKIIFQDLDETYFLNFFIPFVLSYELKNNFQKKNKNLIINIGSNAYKTFPIQKEDIFFKKYSLSYKRYCKSKLFLLYITAKLNELKNKNFHCCYVHPGFVKTDIFKNFPFAYKIFFKILRYLRGIEPDYSSKFIINNIIFNNKKRISTIFDYNKTVYPKDIFLNKEFKDKIWKLNKERIIDFKKL